MDLLCLWDKESGRSPNGSWDTEAETSFCLVPALCGTGADVARRRGLADQAPRQFFFEA